MYVCVCVRVCPIFNVSNPNNSQTAWDINMKFGTQWSNYNPIFMAIDVWFVILWDFEFFEKRTW